MAQTIRQNVDAVDDILATRGAGARIEIQRDTTSAFPAPTSLTAVPLVEGQTQYEIYDPAGDAGNWYRTRVTTLSGTQPSEWSIFQAGAPTAYASVDALRELLQLPDDSRDNLLSDILRRVTVKINTSLRFDFFRHPQVSGTQVRTYDGANRDTISDLQGFASVSQVRWATRTGGTWTTATVNDWVLRLPAQDGGPYLSLSISDAGALPYWYSGYGTIEVTGVRGYLSIPEDIEQAALYWAADLYRVGAYGGSQFGTSEAIGGGVGLAESGQSRFAGGMPRITWETIEDYKRRHHIWLVV